MRTLNLRLLSLLLLAAFVTAGIFYGLHEIQIKRNAGVLLREAALAQDRGDIGAAIDFLGRYLLLVPNDSVDQLAEMSLLQAKLGHRGQAFAGFEKVLRQDPTREEIRRRLVEVATAMGRYVDAQHHLEILLEDSHDDVSLLELKAQCQIGMGENDAASETLEEIIKNDPARLEAYSGLAQLQHVRMKNTSRALDLLDEMVDNNSANYLAYVVRGTFWLELLRVARSAADSGELPTEKSGDPASPSTGQPNNIDAALADAIQALEMAPDEEAAILFAARCFVASDQIEEASMQAHHGARLFPKNGAFFALLAEMAGKAGHRDKAISWLERGLAANAKQSDLLWNLSNLLIDAGRHAEAEAVIEQLRQIRNPKPYPTAPLRYLEARILVEKGEWFKASGILENLRPALTEWPDLLKQADYRLGRCYGELGRIDLQLTAFRRAAGVDSHWLPARMGVAAALWMMGRIDEALEEYEQLHQDPRSPISVRVQEARLQIMVNLRRNASERDWEKPALLLKEIKQVDAEKVKDGNLRGEILSAQVSVPILGAEILLAQDEESEAEDLLKTARDRSPKTVEFWLGLAALADRRENWEQAGKILDDAQAALGDSVEIRLARARHLVNRNADDVKELLHELAKADASFTSDDQTKLFSGLAALTLAIGDFDESRRLCTLVAEQEKSNLRVRLLLFDLAYRSNDPLMMESALDEVKEIERLGPLWHYGEAVRLSVVAKKAEDNQTRSELYAKAKAHLSEARVARSAWSRIPLLLAEINEAQGDKETAISNFKEAVRLGERSPEIISQTVALLYKRNRFEEADQLIRRLEEQQSPFSNNMMQVAAVISMRLNETERAVSQVAKAAKTSVDPKEHVWAGRILTALGRNKEAKESFDEAIKLDETFADAWGGRIFLLHRNGNTEAVEAALEDAKQKIKPDEKPSALAQVFELIGRFAEAEEYYRAAVDRAPDEIPVIRRLAEFYLKRGNVQAAEPVLSSLLDRLKDASDEDRMWCRQNLAVALMIRGKDSSGDASSVAKKALALVAENLKIQPNSESDLRARAIVLALSPDRESRLDAAGILEKIVAAEKSVAAEGTSESLFVLAQLYAGLDDLPRAAGHLRSLIAKDGDNPRYLTYYIQFLLSRNEVGEAALWLPNLQKNAPKDFATWKLKTEIEFRQEHYDDLLATIDRFIENSEASERLLVVARSAELLEIFAKRLEQTRASSDSLDASRMWAARFIERAEQLYRKDSQDRPQDNVALAAFLGRRGKHAESLDILEKEWEHGKPENIVPVTITLLTSADATEEHFARAEKLLRAALDKSERPATLLLALADLQTFREKYDDAESLYRQVLAEQPQNATALNNLALLLALRGRGGQESMALIDKAIEIVGSKPALLDTRATIRLALGNPKEALADVEQSLAGQPSAVAFFHQSLVEHRLGQKPAARLSLEKANDLGLRPVDLLPLERPALRQLQKDMR